MIEDFSHPHLTLRLISVPQSPLQKGLSLKIDRSSYGETTLTLFESQEQGFAGLFQLNQWAYLPRTDFQDKAFIECQFIDQYHHLRYHAHALFPPLIWSYRTQQFKKHGASEVSLENLDMVFLYNSSVIDHFKTEEAVEEWCARVLRHFAENGLETIQTMFNNELTFLAKKQQIQHNFKIIGIQVKI